MNNSQGQDISRNADLDSDIKISEEPNVCPFILKTVVTECLNSWVNYLQVLNSFCSAGFKLSQCLGTLAQTQTIPLAAQCQASWEELGKATIIASSTVKTHIAAAMQDIIVCETLSENDVQKQYEHNQQIIYENLLTFINLQYQFSIAGCECFGAMATCPCCQTVSGVHDPDCSMATLQQCFSKLYSRESQSSSPQPSRPSELLHPSDPHLQETSPPPDHSLIKGHSPIHTPPFDITIRSTHIENMRQPGPFPAPGLLYTMKSPFSSGIRGLRSPLHFPLFPLSAQRRWSEAAAGDMGGDVSADGTMRRWSMPWDCARIESGSKFPLNSKLSIPACQERSRSNTPCLESICNPSITSSEGLVEAIQLLSCRPPRANVTGGQLQTSHEPVHSEMPSSHKRLQHVHSHRNNWTENSQNSSSRKSSSSTDSSSCLSIHSRSTSCSERGSDGGGESVRLHSHLYSIWSGSDHLPFIKLPESQEPLDDSDTESADNSNHSLYPRPT